MIEKDIISKFNDEKIVGIINNYYENTLRTPTMNEWNKILTVYQNFSSVDKSEVLWLKEKFSDDNFDNNLSWIELSDKEKQIKRIVRLKVISRSTDYTLGFSNYEDGVIDLYESIEKSLANIDSMTYSDLRVCRLKLYLLLTKKKINAYRNPRDIKELFYRN